MTGRAMGKHLIKLYSSEVKIFLKIDDIKQLCREIDKDPIIKNAMADISALMVSTFGKWLSPILIVCHMANYTKGFVTAKTIEEAGARRIR